MKSAAWIAVGAVMALALATGTPASAQAKKKPGASQTKPKPKPAVLGTQQLRGDQIVIGQPATVGKTNPINICVTSLEYACGRAVFSDHQIITQAGEKFLIINLWLQNPISREQYVRYDTIRFTAVDGNGENHEAHQNLGVPETKAEFAITLKPGQRKSAYAVVTIPAKASIKKLMVLPPEANEGVLRCDLSGAVAANKIKPLGAPYADPADPTGATALDTVTVAMGAAYPIGDSDNTSQDVTVEKVEPVADIKTVEATEDERMIAITVTLLNTSTIKQLYRFDTLNAFATLEDGEKVEKAPSLLHATQDREYEQNVEAGATMRGRYIIKIAKQSKVKSITLQRSDRSRSFTIPVSL